MELNVNQAIAFFYNSVSQLLFPEMLILIAVLSVMIFWKRRYSKYLFISIFLLFYVIASGLLPEKMYEDLESDLNIISSKDILDNHAMIILGGGVSHYPRAVVQQMNTYSRPLEAYRIFHYAKKHGVDYTIFISGGDPANRGVSEAQLIKNNLISMGVPEHDIITEDQSKSTFQNASLSRCKLKHYPFKQYLLITSALHMKRSQRYFKFFGIKTIAAPSDFPYTFKTWHPTSYNLALYSMALHEYLGFWRLHLYNTLGLNKAAVNSFC